MFNGRRIELLERQIEILFERERTLRLRIEVLESLTDELLREPKANVEKVSLIKKTSDSYYPNRKTSSVTSVNDGYTISNQMISYEIQDEPKSYHRESTSSCDDTPSRSYDSNHSSSSSSSYSSNDSSSSSSDSSSSWSD